MGIDAASRDGIPAGSSVREDVRGNSIGKYRILAEIGHGGMANVFLAVAKGPSGFNKLVVLKALLPHLASDLAARQAFIDEAKLAARLNHPNVVQTYEIGEEGGRHVIVMEHLEGQTLYALLQRARELTKEPLALPIHLRILLDSLEGLHYTHELCDFDGTPLHLVHRDVSPQNVFVTYDGQVKLLDFGIAKAVTSSLHTEAGVFKGKVAYMSPEQVLGTPIDARADLFAVGAMLWEAAAGERLWKGQSDVQILHRVARGEIPSPREANPRVDRELERITMKALAPELSLRYPTAAALAIDLERYLASLSMLPPQRAIGKLVAGYFERARTELRALLERRVHRANALDTNEYAAVDIDRISASLLSTGTPSATRNSAAMDLREEKPSRRPAYVFALLFVLGLGAGLTLWRSVFVTTVRHAASTAPSVTARPSTPRTVELRFSASPPEAKLFFDDDALANPTTRLFAVDGAQHTLRAEAPGYETKSATVGLSSGATIQLALERSPAPVTATKATEKPSLAGRSRPSLPTTRPANGAPTAPRPATTATAPPTKPTGCDHPFYVDDRGIKTMRPECL